MDILDPRITTERDHIDYAPRPQVLKALRVGIVENTKKNAEDILRILADKLQRTHGMQMSVVVHKPQRAPLTDAQAAQLQGKVDIVITGVGD
jgi:hypothetical protein